MQVLLEQSEDRLILSIPKSLVGASSIRPGSLVDVTLVDDKIVLAPVRRSRYRIEDLMVGVTDENMPEKIDFGPPVGKELL